MSRWISTAAPTGPDYLSLGRRQPALELLVPPPLELGFGQSGGGANVVNRLTAAQLVQHPARVDGHGVYSQAYPYKRDRRRWNRTAHCSSGHTPPPVQRAAAVGGSPRAKR